MEIRNRHYSYYSASRFCRLYHTRSGGFFPSQSPSSFAVDDAGTPSSSSASSQTWRPRFAPCVRLSHELGRVQPPGSDSSSALLQGSSSDRSAAKDICLLRWESDLTTTATSTAVTPMSSLALFVESNDLVLRKGTYTSIIPCEGTAVEEVWEGSCAPAAFSYSSSSLSHDHHSRNSPRVSSSPFHVRGTAEPKASGDEDVDEDPRLSFAPIWSGQWRPLCRSDIPFSSNSLSRITCCKGGRGDGSWWSNVVAVSSDVLVQVSVAESGIRTLQQFECADADRLANVTCVDTWGEYGTVYGLSTGEVGLVDWRQNVNRGSGGVLRLNVGTPPWVKLLPIPARIRRLLQLQCSTFSVPFTACCALEDNYRVVCSFGESKGSVVVADLRGAGGGVEGRQPGKKSLRSAEDKKMAAMLCAVGTTPTSQPIVDMQRCPGLFGHIGMIDSAGTSFVTTLSQLEQRRCPAEALEPEQRAYYLGRRTEEESVAGGDGSAHQAYRIFSRTMDERFRGETEPHTEQLNDHSPTAPRRGRSKGISGPPSRNRGSVGGRTRSSSLRTENGDPDRREPQIHVGSQGRVTVWHSTPFVQPSSNSTSSSPNLSRQQGRSSGRRSTSSRPSDSGGDGFHLFDQMVEFRDDGGFWADGMNVIAQLQTEGPRSSMSLTSSSPANTNASRVSSPLTGRDSTDGSVSAREIWSIEGDQDGLLDVRENSFEVTTSGANNNDDDASTNTPSNIPFRPPSPSIGIPRGMTFSVASPLDSFVNNIITSPANMAEGLFYVMGVQAARSAARAEADPRAQRCTCVLPTTSVFRGPAGAGSNMVVASTMPNGEIRGSVVNESSGAKKMAIGKAAFFSTSTYGTGLPHCHGSKQFIVPSSNDLANEFDLMDIFSALFNRQRERYTCISSVDNIICYHSTLGETICVQV